jgi:Cu(I)/Ag(I) efflux system protein CusF
MRQPKRSKIMSKVFFAAVVAGALLAPAAFAEDAHHKGKAGAAQSGAALSDGEVRKVDKDAKKITIKHGPISSINMPPMTMVFQVKDPAMLDQVKTGDKVRFEAEKAGSAYVVTKIESAN